MNFHRELKTANDALKRARKVRCTCPNRGLIKLGIETCTCSRAEQIRLATAQVTTVTNAIREANQKLLRKEA